MLMTMGMFTRKQCTENGTFFFCVFEKFHVQTAILSKLPMYTQSHKSNNICCIINARSVVGNVSL